MTAGREALAGVIDLGIEATGHRDLAGDRSAFALKGDINPAGTGQFPLDPSYGPWIATYTDSGQRSTVTRGTDVWQWTYEPLTSRLATIIDPSGRAIRYGYDRNGSRTSVTTSQGTTRFEYDELNRLTKVIDRLNGETTYAYDATKGVLDHVTYANATKTTYGYDPLDRVNSIEHRKVAGNALLGKFEYTLGLTGRREAVHEEIDDGTLHTSDVSYGYDDLDRLISESRTGWPQAYALEFEYDDVGNRRKQTRGTAATHYAYDVRDRLQCESATLDPNCASPTVSYGWDDAGRMTSRGSETFTWDPEDRLLTHDDGVATTFAYDLDGIRFRKTASSVATEFRVDANRQYQEVLEEWTAGTPDTLAMEYALGPAILWQRDGAGVQRWFHGDAQMSTRILTSPTPSVESKLTYEAFGSDVAPPSTMPTSYRYTGQQADSATQGYYLRARYMSPTIGSFLSTDPVDGRPRDPASRHRYSYAEASPTLYHDPTGREVSLVSVAVSAAVTGILSGIWGGIIGHAESDGDWDHALKKAGREAITGAIIGASAPFVGAAFGVAAKLVAKKLAQGAGRGLGWLATHERFGGHTLLKHVGQGVEGLLARLRAEPWIRGASSFADQEAAEVAISRALGVSRDAIGAWIRGGSRDLVIEHALWPQVVGYGVDQGATQLVNRYGVRLVLRRMADGARWYIHTAFPI